MIRPFAMCLRNSIQKFGAVSGLGLFVSVRYRKGSEAGAGVTVGMNPFNLSNT